MCRFPGGGECNCYISPLYVYSFPLKILSSHTINPRVSITGHSKYIVGACANAMMPNGIVNQPLCAGGLGNRVFPLCIVCTTERDDESIISEN